MYFTRSLFHADEILRVMKMKMTGHHLKYLLLLIVVVHEFIAGGKSNLDSYGHI